jgi:hypothetical protein
MWRRIRTCRPGRRCSGLRMRCGEEEDEEGPKGKELLEEATMYGQAVLVVHLSFFCWSWPLVNLVKGPKGCFEAMYGKELSFIFCF